MSDFKEKDLLNQGIKFSELLVVTTSGEKVKLTKENAIKMAQEEGLDLLLVSPNANPPVAKILDYGHYKYAREKKNKDSKKQSQKGNVLKELKLTPRIGSHDFMVRVKRGREFLNKGFKVKLTVFFKGREATHLDLGYKMIERFLKEIEDLGWAEDTNNLRPVIVGRMMSVLIVAGKKKPVENEKEAQGVLPTTENVAVES